MGLSNEELLERRNDPKVKYIADRIVNKDSGKPFVFISYKSDEWKIVLKDAVYRLVKDYGLNVYFDGDFDTHNSLWVRQFPENMDSFYCKGVIAFISNKYVRSYATLMELMHSQTYAASGEQKKGLPVVPFNLETLNKNSMNYTNPDTGLGRENYDDGSVNNNAKAEKKRFDEDFQELVDEECNGILRGAKFIYKNKDLRENSCFDIFRILIASLGVNENKFEAGYDLKAIVETIRHACGDEVFRLGSVNENTTLLEFRKLCEDKSFVQNLRKVRENAKKQLFDYFVASLLGGCDDSIEEKGQILSLSRYNYCVYVISEVIDWENPKVGASKFTWSSNARKAMRKKDMPPYFFNEQGKVRSGKLGKYNESFKLLDVNMKIGELLEKYKTGQEGFNTKDNSGIFEAWSLIKDMDVSTSKKSLEELIR